MLYSIACVAALGLGAAFGLYLPMNSLTARLVASPFLANIAFFGFGLLTAIILALLAGNRTGDLVRFAAVPWWMYMAGILSGLMIVGSAFLIPRIGPGPFFVFFIAGQVMTGVLIGHMGWFRVVPDAVTLKSLAGIGLVILGAGLVTSR